jgi:hypothetical protein
MRFLSRLFSYLIQQLSLPLHIFLSLFVTQLVERVHMCQILVDILKLGVCYRLLHFEVVHQLCGILVPRAFSYVFFLLQIYKEVNNPYNSLFSHELPSEFGIFLGHPLDQHLLQLALSRMRLSNLFNQLLLLDFPPPLLQLQLCHQTLILLLL